MIFVVGICVTLVTMVGGVLIGLRQAASPRLSRLEDLASWERKLVLEERARRENRGSEPEGVA